MVRSCRLLQLSDPHLLADPRGRCRGLPPLQRLQAALRAGLAAAERLGQPADGLLISGDLCHDESWGGYVRLGELLADLPLPVALVPGNHDRPLHLRALLGRRAHLAPALVPFGAWDLLLLDSHRPGCLGGWIGPQQLAWLEAVLNEVEARQRPLLVALHHPLLPIGDALLDTMLLHDAPALMAQLERVSRLGAIVFGHIHQHWRGCLPNRPEVPLLGCPSTLQAFGPSQPCPLGLPQSPGGRLLDLGRDGSVQEQLLRWDPASAA